MKKKRRNTVKGCLAAALVILTTTITAAAQTESITVPKEVKSISEALGKQYNICPELIQAICYRESRFKPDAENEDCIGIMQVSEKWHKERMKRLKVNDLLDMEGNMTVAVDYLAELAEENEDIAIILMKYNGDSRVQEVMEGTGEISDYAAEIMELSAKLERQHGK